MSALESTTLQPQRRDRVLEFGPFRFNPADGLLSRNGEEAVLPPRVAAVLDLLLQNRGAVVSKQTLIERVWNGSFVTETSLTEAISALRQVLGDDAQNPEYIQTVHRRGYRFIAEVRRSDEKPPIAPSAPSWRQWVLAGSLVAAALIIAAAVVTRAIESRPGPRPVHLSLGIGADEKLYQWLPSLAISPDGRQLVYAAERGEELMLHHRSFDTFTTRVIDGTEGGFNPFFSPDGEWLGFFTGDKLMKVRLSGGDPITVCTAPKPYGLAWMRDGSIVFGAYLSGLRRVSANGGTPQLITTPKYDQGEVTHAWPEVLPDGSIMFTIFGTTMATAKIAVLENDRIRVVMEGAGSGRYVPTGHLIYANSEAVAVAPFDVRLKRITGPPAALSRDIAFQPFNVFVHLTVSQNGTLAFLPSPPQAVVRELVHLRDDGKLDPFPLPQRFYRNLRISPDRRRAAITILHESRSDVWVADLSQGTLSRLTFDGFNIEPVWSPNGEWVYYASNRSGPFNIYRRRASGAGPAERVQGSAGHQYPVAFSPDGESFIFAEATAQNALDLWLSDGRQKKPLIATLGLDFSADISPDGKWVVYASDETGETNVYIRDFPSVASQWQISNEGGYEPFWSADGKTLYYQKGHRVLGVSVGSGSAPQIGKARVVYEGEDVALVRAGLPDGITMIREKNTPESPREIRVILGWAAALPGR